MRQIVITISEIYLNRLSIVAEELHKEGLIITHLYEFGVIIGVAEEELIPRIRVRPYPPTAPARRCPHSAGY